MEEKKNISKDERHKVRASKRGESEEATGRWE